MPGTIIAGRVRERSRGGGNLRPERACDIKAAFAACVLKVKQEKRTMKKYKQGQERATDRERRSVKGNETSE